MTRITDHPDGAARVRLITFDRPQSRNAFDTALYSGVADALDDMVQALALVADRGRSLAACEQRAEALAATLKALRENDDRKPGNYYFETS